MTPFGEVAQFRNGLNYSRENFGSGLKVISVADFANRLTPDLVSLDEINPNDVAGPEDYLAEGDLLFVRSNGNRDLVGRVMLMKGVTETPISFSGFCIRARLREREYYPLFYAYLFRNQTTRRSLTAGSVGANISNVSQRTLARLNVPVPPMDIQRRIGSALANYDDLIATNQRRIALLEAAARRLYREWFVHLRFPGHETVPVVDGVPQGWRVTTFADIVHINPRTPFEKDVERPFVEMSALSESLMVIGPRKTRVIGGGAKFRNGDTLLARITPCIENGKTGFVQFLENDEVVASGSTEFIVLRRAKVGPRWIYCAVREDRFREHAIRSMSGSDGRQRVNPACFAQLTTLLPPLNVLEQFEAAVADSFALIEQLTVQNAKLAQARDLLLPKLMSGQLDVSGIVLPKEGAV
jgi:type I restriction enzyme S subunit